MYLTQGLHRAVQRHPHKMALRHLDGEGGRSWSFAQLADAVARHAAALAARGIRPGDRVAMLSPNNDGLILALWMSWWLGAVACPLNVRWTATEIGDALRDSGARLVLLDESLAHLAGSLEPEADVLPMADLAREAQGQAPRPDCRAGDSALAALLYTGGTTGRSKGVMLTHANFWAASMTRAAELPNPPDGVSLLVAPLFHVAGLGRLVGQSIVGGTCITMPQFRPDLVLEAIAREHITDTVMVPSMLQAVLDRGDFDFSSVQCLHRIAFGAAPMPPDLLDRALEAWPRAEFFQAYGMTETAGAVCINLPESHRGAGRAGALWRSVGRAGLGAEIRIIDDGGHDVPPDTVGEIVVRGPMVTQGYWNLPEATATALRDGWLHTGDGARMDASGYIFIADRLKDMIISGGENVYPAEVENALRGHAGVADAAVIGVSDARWGETVRAVVVPRDLGVLADAQQCEALRLALDQWCRQTLAGYKCPRGMRFVSALPLSAAGKVLKTVLRAEAGAGVAA